MKFVTVRTKRDLRLHAQWTEHGDPLLVAPGTSVLVAANIFAFSRRIPVRFWNLLPHMVVYNGEVLLPLVLLPSASLSASHATPFSASHRFACFPPTALASLTLPYPILSTLLSPALAVTGFNVVSTSL